MKWDRFKVLVSFESLSCVDLRLSEFLCVLSRVLVRERGRCGVVEGRSCGDNGDREEGGATRE